MLPQCSEKVRTRDVSRLDADKLRKGLDMRKRKRHSTGGTILKVFLLILLSVFCICVSVIVGAGIGLIESTPDVDVTDVVPDQYPSHIYDSDGNEIIELSMAGSNREEASYDELPQMLIDAFVAIEDERFFEHNGVDIRGIFRAIYVNLTEDKNEGASTITQQLIKNNVIETGGYERSTGSLIRRKVQEWVMAIKLEEEMSKEEILTNYLNTINLGGGTNGVKAAAKYYFGKELDELTLAECASLAGITRNPTAYNPARFPENNQERIELVLDNMLRLGYITEEECKSAKAEDISKQIVANSSDDSSIYSYFIDTLIGDVLEDLQNAGYTYNQAYNLLFSGGLSIYSTQNTRAQDIIEEELNDPSNYPMETSYSISWNLSVQTADGDMVYYSQRSLANYHRNELGDTEYRLNYASKEEADWAIEEYKNIILEEGDRVTYEDVVYTLQPQVSFTLMDYNTGQVLAVIGGRGDKQQNLSLNRATDTERQPGSTFKVLAAFAPAMDAYNYTLATVEDDSPFEYEGEINREINNWWGEEYRGLSNIRDAIRDSMNIIAAKTIYKIGGNIAVQYLQNFGFSDIDPVEDATIATALGGISNGVTNLELCAAYSTIANSGQYIEPTLYTKIIDRDGQVVLSAQQESRQVIRETVAALLTDAMVDCVESGTGVKCQLNNAWLAGKTGTTSNNVDLWFAGYIPSGLCGTIWSGYDESQKIEEDEYHKDLYSTIMNRIVDELGYAGGEFTWPEGITSQYICHKSGLLDNGVCTADPSGEGVYLEYFEEGTVPYNYCYTHTMVYVCSETGLLANEFCPGVYTVCIIRPDDIKGGAAKGTTSDSLYEVPYEYCSVHSAETVTEEETEEGETTTDEEGNGDDYTDEPYEPEPEPWTDEEYW